MGIAYEFIDTAGGKKQVEERRKRRFDRTDRQRELFGKGLSVGKDLPFGAQEHYYGEFDPGSG